MTAITIIVPVYNVEKYLNRCIDSILGQTFGDFDIILIDDGSTDTSASICDRYSEIDNRVNVIHQTNGGRAKSRNIGIEWSLANSDSKWITFIDSDDWIDKRYLELLLQIAVDNNTKISACGYLRTGGEVKSFDYNEYKEEVCSTEDFYMNHNINTVVPWVKLFTKDSFRSYRFPEDKNCEDEFIMPKSVLQHNQIAYINLPLYNYYINESGFTQSNWNIRYLDGLEAVRENLDFFKNNCSEKLYLWQINNYIINIFIQINQVRRSPEFVEEYEPYLIKLLRKELRHYRGKHTIKLKDNIQLFEIAYPKEMQIYWILKSKLGFLFKEK
ncbi:MAG: glycosyltransferase [Ruminococcus sp.]|nr:glycosyltransferase [Ruminococcus sp.]